MACNGRAWEGKVRARQGRVGQGRAGQSIVSLG